jgi:hypothetical protein
MLNMACYYYDTIPCDMVMGNSQQQATSLFRIFTPSCVFNNRDCPYFNNGYLSLGCDALGDYLA